MKKEKQKWEEEFERTFASLSNWIEKRGYAGTKQGIKDFISALLQQQKEKAVQIVEDMERGGLSDEHEDLMREKTLLEVIKNLKERL